MHSARCLQRTGKYLNNVRDHQEKQAIWARLLVANLLQSGYSGIKICHHFNGVSMSREPKKPKKTEQTPKKLPTVAELKAHAQALEAAKKQLAEELARRRLIAKSNKTIVAIFDEPTRWDIRWTEIENLIAKLDGEIKKGSGSHRRIKVPDAFGEPRRANLSEPHPQPTCKAYTIEALRELLVQTGYEP